MDLTGLERAGESGARGRYRHDLSSAETLETRLGVFSQFRPRIPAELRAAPYVFLGNIDPRLQLDVLRQMERPELVACDTMNFWIESRRNELVELLGMADIILLNDGEARQLTEEYNLVRAARWILARGPRHVVIRKGENGANRFSKHSVFFFPAYPLEGVFDPTGAVDWFANLFGGNLAAIEELSTRYMREKFNSRVDNLKGIRYYSMGFYIPEPVSRHSVVPLLWYVHGLVKQAGEGANDGFVSIESSNWGKLIGVHEADHWSETAPVPFLGGRDHRETFGRVAQNLDAEF